MLGGLFLWIINMSITASCVILMVLLVRPFLKKAPKVFSYALWVVVLFRLICPISFESAIGLLPVNKTPIPQDIAYSLEPQIDTGLSIVDNAVNPILPTPNNMSNSFNPLQMWILVGSIIWAIGMLVMLIYSFIQFVRLKGKLVGSMPLQDNIYLADHINAPFVMGFIKPNIYLPSSTSKTEQEFIIAHELYHIKRLDHIARILGFIALTIHWFNPLVWLAFVLSGKDMEMSCDEAIMQKMSADIRAEYSQSLLRFATGRQYITATPLAFGEGDTKDRVKNVMNYKSPMLWVMALALITVVVLCVGFATNRSLDKSPIRWAKNLQVQDVDKIEMVVQTSVENERYRLFTKDELADIVELVNESKGKYQKSPEPLGGQSITFYITTKDGKRHTFSNIGNTYLMIDGVTYKAEYDWLSSWKYSKGNAMLPSTFSFGNGKLLTLEELKTIAQKGELISWEDFAAFDGRDVGSGLYIMIYPMAEPFYVRVGGVPDELPMYVQLCSAYTEQYIDITKESIDDFIQGETTVISIETLWKNRTEYVGDNSAVGNIISGLNIPPKLKYDGFHLDTEQQPYGIRVNFMTDTETKNFYTEALNQTPLNHNAIIMFSLIGNVDVIHFTFDDGKTSYSESFYRDTAQAMMENENLFAATETMEGFANLVKEIPKRVSIAVDK